MNQPYPPRRPGPPPQQPRQPYPPAQRGHRASPPPQARYQQPVQRQPVYAQPPAPRRRRVWPWVLLGMVLVPVLGFVACTAALGGAVNAVDQARQGGTVGFGETFTYQSGLGISVAVPSPYQPGNQFELARGEVGYQTTITILNGTRDPVGVSLITKNATVNGQPAPEVFSDGTFATQQIPPGQQLQVPFRFKTGEGVTGPLQIAVTDTFNEPVFFNGQIG